MLKMYVIIANHLIFHCTDSSAVRGATTPKRHSLVEPLTSSGGHGGSPSHSRSGSSEGHSSSRRSSRDSGRMVVSPTHQHHHYHHQRHSSNQTSSASVSSGDRSSTSPIPVSISSAYEQMLLNGSSRRSPNQLQSQPRNVGRSISSPDHELPSGATRRIVSIVNHDQPSVAAAASPQQQGHVRIMSSPEATSPSKYVRKPHKYDEVRFPHAYDKVEFTDQGARVLSLASTKSESKLNSTKWSRFAKRGSSEKRPNQPSNMHLSDTRLNKISRRRASDKAVSVRKSPALSKRFSTGAVMTAEGEARRSGDNSQAFVKAKYRVSNPEPGSEWEGQRFSSINEFADDGPGGGILAEEDLVQDVFLTSGDFEQVRRKLIDLYPWD